MNQECVPLVPNTGAAPSQAYEGESLLLFIMVSLLVASIVLAIIYRRRLSKLFIILFIPFFAIGVLSINGFSSTASAQACEPSTVTAPMAIVANDDVFQSEMPSSVNGNNGNNLLKAFVNSMYGDDGNVYTFDYAGYYVTYTNPSPQFASPTITMKLLNNDTVANNLQLDPLSVDLDSMTPGVQQTVTVGAYELEYDPANDELVVTIVNAKQAFEEIIPDMLTVGMPLSEFRQIENRAVDQRTIIKSFTYSVTDTTGNNSATANAVVTVVGEAVAVPLPL